MEEAEAEAEAEAPRQPLRRRNSIATSIPITTKLSPPKHLPTSTSLPLYGTASASASPPPPPSPIDLDLVSLKSSTLSYTSLKDLLPPSAVNSPTSANSACEISIRNRLVKQAAWAYLQPMSSSPDSSGPHFFRRLYLRFSACLRPIVPVITQLFHRILRIIRVPVSK